MSKQPKMPFRAARLAIYGALFTFNGFSIIVWLVVLSAVWKVLAAALFMLAIASGAGSERLGEALLGVGFSLGMHVLALAGIIFAYHATMMMFFPGYKRILTSQETTR